MNCYNGANFQVVDQETYQVYGEIGLTDDFMALEAMSNKQQYGLFGDMSFDASASLQCLPQSYDSPSAEQNELAALPNVTGGDYQHTFLYTPAQSEVYSRSSVASTSAGNFSAVPATTAAQFQAATAQYHTAPANRKRKASVESVEDDLLASKRIHVEVTDPSGEYFDIKDEPSPYSSVVPTPTNMPTFQGPYSLTCSPRPNGHQHSTSNASQMSVPVTAPYTPTISPSFTTANTDHSPRALTTPSPRPASTGSNPKLVRTSTIPQHSPQAIPSNMTLVGSTQNFNPYTLYSPDSKARLHMQGNLDEVGKKWTEEQIDARRKIIIFNRTQKGNDIYADFETVTQENWKNHPQSVSCIWWAEKKEAYVTSVDTILLLEGLVGARFTVEEKNRIRRNLEGFKPDTVSKAKPDTEEFFKVIMGFPNPKPRNIEKDVKVFPWKVLSVALQKIIGKYSASYASTASALAAQPKMQRALEYSDYAYSNSPAPEYQNGMQMANLPAFEQPGRISAPATPTPPMHLTSHMAPGFDQHSGYGYPQIQMPPHSHAHYAGHPMTAPVAAPAYWQHPAYSTDGAMTMVSTSAPPTAYPREIFEAADFRQSQGGYHHHTK